MKSNILFLIFIFNISSIFAQDFDLYSRKTDDQVNLPFVQQSTALNEFQLLSRNARMMDMAYAMVVPGYMHFKAKEYKTAYTLLGLRSLAYIGLSGAYFSGKAKGNTLFGRITSTNDTSGQIQISDEWSISSSDLIAATSIAVIFSTYMYDWIHGKIMLEKKQELIRYKYGLKIQMETGKPTAGTAPLTPSFYFTYSF